MMDTFGNMLILLFICIVCIVQYAGAQCPPNLFGVGCRFECHCKQNENCDDYTGKCPSDCDKYWAGPSCQYKNIAVDAFTAHVYEISNSNLSIDGNLSTCTGNNNGNTRTTQPWWRIWLSTNHTIKELEFVTNDHFIEHFEHFKVTVEYVPEDLAKHSYASFIHPRQEVCYKSNAKVSDNVINVVCSKALVGNQVRIQLEKPGTQLVICDFRIFEGRNIAFGRRASQKSHNSEGQPATAAVDGNTQADSKGACSATDKEYNPWWSVDLAHVMAMDKVLITALDTNDISGYQLSVSNDSLTWIGVYNDAESIEHKTDIKVNVVARFIKISFENVANETKQLILCEVQIFGDCLPDVCGFDCVDVCHCKQSNSEIKMSGKCTNGCQDKWTGEEMKCDRAAPCTETSGIVLSAVAVALTVGAFVVLIVGSVCVTVFIMKRRQTGSSEPQTVQTRPSHLKKMKTRVLSAYYNMTLKPKKTKVDPDQGQLEGYMELDIVTQQAPTEGYLELDQRRKKPPPTLPKKLQLHTFKSERPTK